jgi:hypothetical protein
MCKLLGRGEDGSMTTTRRSFADEFDSEVSACPGEVQRASPSARHAPDIYMDKIVVCGGLPEGVADLDAAPGETRRNLARAKQLDPSDLVVFIESMQSRGETACIG